MRKGVEGQGSLTIELEPLEEPCPGDLDGDGTVGGGDIGSLLADWGKNPGSPADFDLDGFVGGSDIGQLLSYWGPCP